MQGPSEEQITGSKEKEEEEGDKRPSATIEKMNQKLIQLFGDPDQLSRKLFGFVDQDRIIIPVTAMLIRLWAKKLVQAGLSPSNLASLDWLPQPNDKNIPSEENLYRQVALF